VYKGITTKWVSTGLFQVLFDGLGHSKSSLLCAGLLKTSKLKVLEDDGKDNNFFFFFEKLYLEKFGKIY
jgi:hypothetical protein